MDPHARRWIEQATGHVVSPSDRDDVLFYIDGRPVWPSKTNLFMRRYGRGVDGRDRMDTDDRI